VDDGQATQILKLIGEKSKVQVLSGFYRGLDGLRVTVDVGGGRIPADVVTQFRPEVNEPVTVMIVDGSAFMVGPTIPKPGQGTVLTAPAGGYVSVSTDIGNILATYPAGASLTSGQQVKLFWSDGPHVISVMSTTPVVQPPEEGGGTGGGERAEVFTAVDAGSYRGSSGWWQSQVWASDGNLGSWFYSTKLPDTIPSNAQMLSIEIYLPIAAKYYDTPPNFAVHRLAAKVGEPDLYGMTPIGTGGDGWYALPIGFANELKKGGGALGVGVRHGGYTKFHALSADGMSGALRIRWRT
jgi:hypothetical protein